MVWAPEIPAMLSYMYASKHEEDISFIFAPSTVLVGTSTN